MFRRPSPALAVSFLALGVALGGTATAATTLIKSSSQVRAGSIVGSDVKNRSLTGVDLASGSVSGTKVAKEAITADKLAASVRNQLGAQGLSAVEAIRKAGPEVNQGGSAGVATLRGLAPGTYAITAKTVLVPTRADGGVLTEVVRQDKTISGRCKLGALGDVDDSVQPLVSPGSQGPSTYNMQLTTSLATAGDVTVTCEAATPYRASDTSIIATRLAGTTRTDVTG